MIMRLKKFGGWLLLGMFFVGAANAQEVADEVAREKQPVKKSKAAKKASTKAAQQMTEAETKKIASYKLLRKLIYKADTMIKGKKAAEAYALLEPYEGIYSGEVYFDHVLGVAALDSGKPDRAAIAFERVLAINPNFAGARLDLERAHFAMKKANTKVAQQPVQSVEAEVQPAANTIQEMPKPAAEAVRQPTEAEMKKIAAYELLRGLIYNADIMIKSKRAAEAYALLEPYEGIYSGEIYFDYLLGMAALDSGKPDRATIAFERVLAVNPKFSGARLDLARAYFAMGSDDLAKNEFNTVLSQNPHEQTAAVIKKYIEAIDERHQAKIQKITAYLETSVGYDDNVASAPGQYEQGIADYMGYYTVPALRAAYNTVITPGAGSLQYTSMFEGVSGGVDFTRLVSEENGVSLFAGADVKHRVYNKVNALNNSNLDLRAGVSIANGVDNYKVTGSFGRYWQAGFTSGTTSNMETIGLGTEWKRSFGARDQMIWSLNFSQPRYVGGDASPPAKTNESDTRQAALSGSWLHIFEGTTVPLIFVNANQSVDRAVHLKTNGSNVGRTTNGALVHFQFTPLADTDFFLSGGYTVRHDDSPAARGSVAGFYARDVTKTLTAGVTVRPWAKWSIKGVASATDNNSNISLYTYRHLVSTVSLRRDF